MNLDDIYQNFDNRLRRFIRGRVSDNDAAEDILQYVYLKIHTSINELRDEQKLEKWIYQITRNAIIDHYRRARPEDEISEYSRALDAEEPDAITELAPSVHEMLACLPDSYRDALTMTDIQGISQVELAGRLVISISGVKSRVQRAREKLKEAFLDCCHFEFDRQGKVIGYEPRCSHCDQNQSTDCGKC